MPSFEYHRPTDLKETCRMLEELPEAQVLAGGTDLLLDIDAGLRAARHVISLQTVSELAQIDEAGSTVSLGAACTASQVEVAELVRDSFPELAEMVVKFASPQIRTRATVAGNICSAVPCGDFPVILMALGADVELASIKGRRTVPLAEFFTGPRETVRAADEILTRIVIPKKSAGARGCYQKFQRRASNSLAVASAGAVLRVENGAFREARIVLGAVAPTPLLAKKASASLTGKAIDEETIRNAAAVARDEAIPITDVRGTENYRRELVYVLTRRAIERAVERIGGGG
jgi:carbon-monoxide dehydrogenase medium subunit